MLYISHFCICSSFTLNCSFFDIIFHIRFIRKLRQQSSGFDGQLTNNIILEDKTIVQCIISSEEFCQLLQLKSISLYMSSPGKGQSSPLPHLPNSFKTTESFPQRNAPGFYRLLVKKKIKSCTSQMDEITLSIIIRKKIHTPTLPPASLQMKPSVGCSPSIQD